MEHNRYTLQTLGRGAKLLRTEPRSTESVAITTITDLEAARTVAWQLNHLDREAHTDTGGAVFDLDRAGLEPAWLRRRALTAFDAAHLGEPDARQGRWWCENVGHELGSTLTGQSSQVAAAVRGELALLLEHLDEVLVEVKITRWTHDRVVRGVLNSWLSWQADFELEHLAATGRLDPGSIGPWDLYDMFAAQISSELDLSGDEVDELDISVEVNRMRAWMAHHRPHLKLPAAAP